MYELKIIEIRVYYLQTKKYVFKLVSNKTNLSILSVVMNNRCVCIYIYIYIYCVQHIFSLLLLLLFERCWNYCESWLLIQNTVTES